MIGGPNVRGRGPGVLGHNHDGHDSDDHQPLARVSNGFNISNVLWLNVVDAFTYMVCHSLQVSCRFPFWGTEGCLVCNDRYHVSRHRTQYDIELKSVWGQCWTCWILQNLCFYLFMFPTHSIYRMRVEMQPVWGNTTSTTETTTSAVGPAWTCSACSACSTNQLAGIPSELLVVWSCLVL